MRLRSFALLGFMLLLALVPLVASAQPQPLDRIVAVVNKDAIMQSQLEDRVAQVRKQMASRDIPVPSRDELRRQVLDRMVVEQIQLQMAERANVSVDDTQLNAAVRKIAENNGMSLDEFADSLEKNGMSLATVREQVRREMLLRQVQQSQVASRVNVTDSEVDRYLDQQGSTSDTAYHLGHLLVSLPQSPSPEQVEQARAKARELYRQLQNGADFQQLARAESDGEQASAGGDLGWRRGDRLPTIFADVVPQLADGEVSEPVRSASGFHLVKRIDTRGGQSEQKIVVTENRVRHILIGTNPNRNDEQAQALAQDIRQRIAEGASFAAMAQQYSDDDGTALDGGELGWVRPGQMVPAFEDAVNRMTVGELSQPVRSRFGYHVIKLEDRRKKDVTREAQREQIRQTLFQRKVNNEMEAWLQEIRADAYIDIRLEDGQQ
ncbi:periplasmic chaperone for outer membrane proteins SurA [Chromohalobacter marismortui]|uniref:Chaperone SurA n=1 Tax=Chromohalobacter marismortui TaxID=42055 RepID=A0A4R7NRV5_9GAMM|nr:MULTISPECIES: peptidylprolyl isomerase [Chromohalobacter]MCI0511281.1 peptidylprolyl isomerase [Chromohalobacter sp.]MCI0592241.1 peptidylprolyl isomerase [Chromohalobacter sp.]TDU23703.1 periplasmic chaperone for outer membrane proteins SurA [Chromohalobacter marismortui]